MQKMEWDAKWKKTMWKKDRIYFVIRHEMRDVEVDDFLVGYAGTIPEIQSKFNNEIKFGYHMN